MPNRIACFALAMAALSSAALVQAQGPAPAAAPAAAPAPASPEKKRLIERVIQLQMPGVEALGRQLAEQPAMQMGQQASQALQRLPVERREAVARDIQADLRQYVEEMGPPMRDRAVRLAPGIMAPLLEERFSEQELREVIALLESPTLRKFQNAGPELQRALGERIVAESRASIEQRAKVLEQSIIRRLNPPAAAGSAPATAAPGAPAAARPPSR
jgi:uncharacterized protein